VSDTAPALPYCHSVIDVLPTCASHIVVLKQAIRKTSRHDNLVRRLGFMLKYTAL
jgi:hypothetical protein